MSSDNAGAAGPPAWPLLVAFGALLAATLGLGASPSRVPVGDDRVPDPIDALDAWDLAAHGEAEAEATPDGVWLQAHQRTSRATLWHHPHIDSDHAVWDAAVRIRVPGRGRRVQLVVAAQGGRTPLWFGSYRIGAEGWGWVRLPVTGRLDGQQVQVGVIAVGEGASALVSHVDLVPMTRRPWWTAALIGLVGGWLALGAAAARRAGTLATGAGALLLVGVVLPRPWVDVVLGRVQHVQVFGMPFAFWGQKLLGHGGLFAVVGFAVARRYGAGAAAGATVTLALATEASQLLAVARSASLSDVALDLAGATVGVAVARALKGRPARRTPPGSPG